MLIGGAIINAVAFSGSNYLFSSFKSKQADEERKRHDLALEHLTQARDEWSKKRTKYLDYVNEKLRKEAHAKQTFTDIDRALQEYYIMTGSQFDIPQELQTFNKPKLSDYYTPSEDQKTREILFILAGLGVVGFATYEITKD